MLPFCLFSAVVITEHAVQQLVAEVQCPVVVDLDRSLSLGQVDLARALASGTVRLEDRQTARRARQADD